MNYQKALQTLNLSHPPSPAEVKKSYRKMALRYHPDRNDNDPSAAKLFRDCTEAYNYLLENIQQWVDGGSEKTATRLRVAAVEDLENIFDDIFGFTREDRILGYQKPQNLSLTLMELAFGTVKEVRLTAFEKCGVCQGSGAATGTHALICTHCFGAGQIRSTQEGKIVFKVCPKCSGRGRNVRQPCSSCNGFGRKEKFRKQRVTIPSGLASGEVYTLHSADVKTGIHYDLFICPQLIPHELFTVEKCDILCQYPLDKLVVSQGGNLEIPTLWGWASLKIMPGTTEGMVYSLQGLGLPVATGQKQKGDLKVKIHLVEGKFFRKEAASFLKKVSLKNSHYPSPPSFWKRLFS